MQAYYPDGSPYRSMRHAFASIWQDGAQNAVAAGASPVSGGLRALYRGVEATTIRGIVLSATQICSYDQIKQSLKKRGIMQEGVPLHFVASTFAGYVNFCVVTSRVYTDLTDAGCSARSLRIQLVSGLSNLDQATRLIIVPRRCQSQTYERQDTSVQGNIRLYTASDSTRRAVWILQGLRDVLG